MAAHGPIASSSGEQLLGIKIDQKLSFEPRDSICKQGSQKLNALARMASSSLKFKQWKLLLNALN